MWNSPYFKGNCGISKEYNGSLIIPPPLLWRYSPYLKGRARLDTSVRKSSVCPMESVDRKQWRMHSAWRSPLKIGGVPPLAGRGYDYYIRYSLNVILLSLKIGRGYDSFLSVSLKFVGKSVFSPPHSRQTPEIA